MWSNLYWYFQIRGDENLNVYADTHWLVDILNQQGQLLQTGPQVFSNNKDFPWINITCVISDNDNYSHHKTDSTKTSNLIIVVASRTIPSNYPAYVNFMTKVSDQLGWELILEEDDDGNENVILNK